MTDKEKEEVILETLRILADCELGRMALARNNTQNQLANPILPIDQRVFLKKTLSAIQSMGDKLDSLIKRMDGIRKQENIIAPK